MNVSTPDSEDLVQFDKYLFKFVALSLIDAGSFIIKGSKSNVSHAILKAHNIGVYAELVSDTMFSIPSCLLKWESNRQGNQNSQSISSGFIEQTVGTKF